MTELELRVAATSATFARFNGQPLMLGKTDCARMVAFHLKQLGFKASLLKAGAYSTEVGARRALTRLGVTSLSEIMDRHFERIAPAQAVVGGGGWVGGGGGGALEGDVCCVRADGDMGDAMQVKLNRNHVLGFLDGACGELVNQEYVAAWRVL